MNIKLHGKSIDLGSAYRTYMEDAIVPTLGKYFSEDNIKDISVHVSKRGKGFIIAIETFIAKNKIAASGESMDPHGGFDLALEKVAKQVRRFKRRLKNHHANAVPQFDVLQSTEQLEPANDMADNPAIVSESSKALKVMSVIDAADRMDRLGAGYMLFRDAKTDLISAVYHRDDGNIGWVNT